MRDRRFVPRVHALVPLVAVAIVIACAPEAVVSSTEVVTGPGTVYGMATVNDLALPATFAQDGQAVEVRKGALTVGPDSTFIFSVAYRSQTNNGQPASSATTLRGSVRRPAGALVLLSAAGDTLFTGSASATGATLLAQRAPVVGNRFTFTR